MYDEMMFSLLQYIFELNRDVSYWKKDLFAQQNYAIWAAKEIYYLLCENETCPPEMIVEEFANKMDDYACKRKETSFMFSIAHDTAIDILDQIIYTIK